MIMSETVAQTVVNRDKLNKSTPTFISRFINEPTIIIHLRISGGSVSADAIKRSVKQLLSFLIFTPEVIKSCNNSYILRKGSEHSNLIWSRADNAEHYNPINSSHTCCEHVLRHYTDTQPRVHIS